MSGLKQIKAVLFDMDGVLIDAKEWHYEALNEALEMFGTNISRHDHLTSFDGLPTKVKLQKLSLAENLPKELHGFINELKQKFTMQHVYKKCSPFYAHQYALSNLKQKGYKIGVCSNSIRDTIDVMMELSALKPYLDKFWSAEDVKAGKPDPEIYTQAIEYFGLSPDEVVILEDNENGIKAAQASGAHCMVVEDTPDVNYANILAFISDIESKGA
jgi:HAD superfamily hydrolase (TIGR01509 family)